MSDEPWLWLLAGPNGAGKSTFAERNFTDIEGISPDRSALQLEPTAPERVAFLAGRKARLRMRDLLDGRRSFWVETTLSGRSHYRDIQRAKTQGSK
jgi:predicted ABC-type ATPase